MDDSPDELLLALLDRYLAGECSSSEAEQVREWLSVDAANRLALAEVEKVRAVARNRPPARSSQDAWRRAVSELGLATPSSAKGAATQHSAARPPLRRAPSFPPIRGWGRRPLVTAAIAASILIGIGVAYQSDRTAVPASGDVLQPREYSTSRGQRATVQLADGSQLTLGPLSRVRVAPNFGERNRDVTLIGEAFFKVEHDAARPFRVHTRNGIAEDLGTEFIVSDFPGQSSTQVVVSSGRVEVGGRTITRGQLARLDANGRVTVSSGVDLDLHFGWIDGRLSFRDMRVDQAFARLSRWYDIDFDLADEALGALPLTASFKDESLAQVLHELDLILGLEHRTHGRRVIFHSPPNASGSAGTAGPERRQP